MKFLIAKPIGLEIKYLPTDQQQCGIPKNKSTRL